MSYPSKRLKMPEIDGVHRLPEDAWTEIIRHDYTRTLGRTCSVLSRIQRRVQRPIPRQFSDPEDVSALSPGARADVVVIVEDPVPFCTTLAALVKAGHWFPDVRRLVLVRNSPGTSVWDVPLLKQIVPLDALEQLELLGVTTQECLAVFDCMDARWCSLYDLKIKLVDSGAPLDFGFLAHPVVKRVSRLCMKQFPIGGPPTPLPNIRVLHIDGFAHPAGGEANDGSGTAPYHGALYEWVPCVRDLKLPRNAWVPRDLLDEGRLDVGYNYMGSREEWTRNYILHAIIPHCYARADDSVDIREFMEDVVLTQRPQAPHLSEALSDLAVKLCKNERLSGPIHSALIAGRVVLSPKYVLTSYEKLYSINIECAIAVYNRIIEEPYVSGTFQDFWRWGYLRGDLMVMLIRLRFTPLGVKCIPGDTVNLIRRAACDPYTGLWISSGFLHSVLRMTMNVIGLVERGWSVYSADHLCMLCEILKVAARDLAPAVMDECMVSLMDAMRVAVEDLIRRPEEPECNLSLTRATQAAYSVLQERFPVPLPHWGEIQLQPCHYICWDGLACYVKK